MLAQGSSGSGAGLHFDEREGSIIVCKTQYTVAGYPLPRAHGSNCAMSFEDLPELPPLIHPAGAAYAARIMDWSRAAQANHSRTVLEVPYGDDYWQKLDVYLPADPAVRDLPLLCFVHGGAWANGCKEWMAFMAPAFCSLPAIFVSISHRLAPAAKYPKPLEDVLDALAWVVRHIGAYGGDTQRIYLGGHSSGGHLAALATLRPDLAARRGIPADVPAACLPMSAPFDLRSDDPVRRQKVSTFLEDLADVREASPVTLAAGNRIPFLIAYGTEDLPELVPQAVEMAAALRVAGCRVEVMALPGLTHFGTHEACRDEQAEWVIRARQWLSDRELVRAHRVND